MRVVNVIAVGLLLFAVGTAHTAGRAEEETGEHAIPRLETTVELEGHEMLVRTLAFHPEGTVLASGGPDRTLRLWSVEQAESIATLTLPGSG